MRTLLRPQEQNLIRRLVADGKNGPEVARIVARPVATVSAFIRRSGLREVTRRKSPKYQLVLQLPPHTFAALEAAAMRRGRAANLPNFACELLDGAIRYGSISRTLRAAERVGV
jgi:hypothetical protein